MKRLFLLAVLLAFTESFPAIAQTRDYWPTTEWRNSTPEKQGLDPSKLRSMIKDVRTNIPQASCIMVVRHGYLVLEQYFGTKPDEIVQTWSATKSIISMLLGIAKDKGLIKDVNQPMLDFFPELKKKSHPSAGKVTLRHLLTMSSGLGTSFTTPDQGLFAASIQFPPSFDAGSRFSYNESDPAIASLIVSKATKLPTADYAKKVLFKPLGIANFRWQAGGSVDLFLKPRDMAKIGYLYLNNGLWEGTQIVSADWVRLSISKQIDVPERDLPKEYQYGFFWWLYQAKNHSAFFSLGIGGQIIYVIPSLDLVYVSASRSSTDQDPELFKMPEKYLVPAVVSK